MSSRAFAQRGRRNRITFKRWNKSSRTGPALPAFQVLVSCRDDAHVGLDRLMPADAVELAVRKHPQQAVCRSAACHGRRLLKTRLLRVLSDGQFYRVGGHQSIKANVRIIAATHQNLESRVKQGLFPGRFIPPLERDPVAPAGAARTPRGHSAATKYFFRKSGRELSVETKKLSEAALKYLSSLDFPGNVRQLENLCHWLTVMAPG